MAIKDFDKMTDEELLAFVPSSIDPVEQRKIIKSEKKQEEMTENAGHINNALAAWRLGKVDATNPAEVSDRILMYLRNCTDSAIPPNVPGVCNYLRIDKKTFQLWTTGKCGRELQDIAERTMMTLEQIWADMGMKNKQYPATGIFMAKNWFGYKDQQDVVLDTQERRDQTAEELAREAAMLPFEDISL